MGGPECTYMRMLTRRETEMNWNIHYNICYIYFNNLSIAFACVRDYYYDTHGATKLLRVRCMLYYYIVIYFYNIRTRIMMDDD